MITPMQMFAVSTGLNVAQGFMGYKAKQEAAKAQAIANVKKAQAATRQFNYDIQALAIQGTQDADALQVDKFDTHIAAMKARSTAQVSAGESGVEGNSVDALLRDFWVQEGRAEMSKNRAYVARLRQRNAQRQASYMNMMNVYAGLQTPRGPSMLGALLGIGAGMAKDYVALDLHKG